jgi:hypothetical protein
MTTATRIRDINLDEITLDRGGHYDSQEAFCVMELTAYIAGEPWSDSPSACRPRSRVHALVERRRRR